MMVSTTRTCVPEWLIRLVCKLIESQGSALAHFTLFHEDGPRLFFWWTKSWGDSAFVNGASSDSWNRFYQCRSRVYAATRFCDSSEDVRTLLCM